MSIRYDENTKARAVRLVREHRDDYDSEWAAMKAISGRLGMNPETLRKWVRQAEVDAGEAAGGVEPREARAAGATPQEPRAGTNDRNTKGRNKFLRAGVRPATPLICRFIDEHREALTGSYRSAGHWPCTVCRSPRALIGRTVRRRRRSGPCGIPRSPKSWPATTNPTPPGKRPPGEPVRQPEDVGAPAARGHPGGAAHGGTDHARNGWRGAIRARRTPRTTEPDPAAARAPDLVGRQWRVVAPNLLVVADFT